MHNPLRSHIKIALKVLRYLKSNPGKGVHIVKQPKTSLEAFVDADWAYKKQHTLAKSSAEAEYIAMASVTSEVTWILKILRDLEWDKVLLVNLYCDSQVAIKISANLVFHERTKHLEIDLHFDGSDANYACSDSLLLTPLCCDDIHDVTPRVSALAGCDRLVSEPLVIENYVSLIHKKFCWGIIFPIGLKCYRDPKEEPIKKEPLMELKEIG
ncbi:ribonuclease H-like domain-containing protein [Tanacetum coccineum]